MQRFVALMNALVGLIGFKVLDQPFERGKVCGSCFTSRLKGYEGVPYQHYPSCDLHTKYAGQTNIKRGTWWKFW
jgi:hypothetical protein